MNAQPEPGETPFPLPAPYFNLRRMDPPRPAYVCWLDVMGSRSAMARSLATSANFVMKLHVAALESKNDLGSTVELYPMIDGIYMCSEGQVPILSMAKQIFLRLARLFTEEPVVQHRFVVRGALAFGPAVEGASAANPDCSRVLPSNADYCGRILLGIPLIQAFEEEKKAAPFGLAVHESARAFSPAEEQPIHMAHWRWWLYDANRGSLAEQVARLRASLAEYYEWCEKHADMILYGKDDIARHRALSEQFFSTDYDRGAGQ